MKITQCSHNFHNSICNRYLNDVSSAKRQNSLQDHILQNMIKDRFIIREMTIDSSNMKSLHHNGHFIVVERKDSISLWNIFFEVKEWDYSKPIYKYSPEDVQSSDLIIGEEGIVIQFVKLLSRGVRRSHIEGCCKGKKICDIFLNGDLLAYQVAHSNIFVLNRDSSYDNNSLTLCQWSQTGKLIREIPIEEEERFDYTMHRCEDYLIINTITLKESQPYSKFFILDLKSSSAHSFNLEFVIKDPFVTSVYISSHHLIIGSYTLKPNEKSILSAYSTISIFNLLTGKVEEEYPFERDKGQIQHVIANEETIFFSCQATNEKDSFCLLDRRTGELKELLKIPKRENEPPCFSVTKQLLTICYTVEKWKESFYTKALIDLKNKALISKISYKRDQQLQISYQSNLLLLPYIAEGKINLYIEDFHSYDSEKK